MTRKGLSVGRLPALGLMLAILMAGTPAWGQEAAPRDPISTPRAPQQGPGSGKPEIPLHVSAAQLEADQDQRLIVFKGQVKAEYGDSTLYTDQLLVFYQPKEKGRSPSPAAGKRQEVSPLGDLGGEKLDRIEARGNVRLVQGDRVATGDKAVYHRDKDEIVLLGNPQIWRGENHLKGTRITFNLASKRVVVESSPQRRVEAHLYQATGGGEKIKESPSSGGSRAAPRTGRPR